MRFPDEARRARLARRHALHPDHRLGDPAAVARAVVTLHATDPSTVHLAVAARMRAATVEAVERALYRERTLVKQLAMRRTLFAFPVAYELTILLAAFGTLGGMFLFNRLPMHYHPVMKAVDWPRATDDRFFLAIDADDPQFDLVRTRAFLREIGGKDIAALEP